MWTVSGAPAGSPVMGSHNRTVPLSLPEASSVDPSGNGTAATARTWLVPVSGVPNAGGAVLHTGSTTDPPPQPATRPPAPTAANPDIAIRNRSPWPATVTHAAGSPAADSTAAHTRPCSPALCNANSNTAGSTPDNNPGAATSSPNRPAAAANPTNRRTPPAGTSDHPTKTANNNSRSNTEAAPSTITTPMPPRPPEHIPERASRLEQSGRSPSVPAAS
ncbi:hypothetical protein GCM10022255_042710 [Dactylosporangium darangshiense]|uniref:Uncharacterized protein n=1 Tax=Dactylosporangium darangshiense TaxID=579108 RepID=A0ABP8DAB9_9ACTN